MRRELEKVFKEQFYNLEKAECNVADLKLTIQYAKRQQGKNKKPNTMDTSRWRDLVPKHRFLAKHRIKKDPYPHLLRRVLRAARV